MKVYKKVSLQCFWLAICVAGTVGIAGCGASRPETGEVTGKVTFAGQPVPSGEITFYPEVGRPASGKIQTDGSFTLMTFSPDDGAIVGKHTVTIKAVEFSGSAAQPVSFKDEMTKKTTSTGNSSLKQQPRWIVPKRYASRQSSGLVAEIHSGTNTVNFNLPAK